MGRDLQKRKRRSSRPAIKQHASSKPHRLLNPLGNDIIAKNWFVVLLLTPTLTHTHTPWLN